MLVRSITLSFLSPHRRHSPRSPTQRVPPERDGNYDKLESVQPQEGTLMFTLQFGINFFIDYI